MTNADFKVDPSAWTLEHHWLLDGEEQLSRDRPPIQELLKDADYLERVRRQAMRRQIYVMTDWGYEGVHFGLMSVFEWPTDVSEGVQSDHVTRHERSIENYYIATSRDGLSWNFHWVYAGQPLVPRGPTGAWDKDMIFPTTQIITHQDKHWIYYGGNNERHGAAEKNVWFERQGNIGLAWLRLDGFVALEAGPQAGTVTTKPFALKGARLQLNVDARNAGQLRVEVLDAVGREVPGYSGNDAKDAAGSGWPAAAARLDRPRRSIRAARSDRAPEVPPEKRPFVRIPDSAVRRSPCHPVALPPYCVCFAQCHRPWCAPIRRVTS